MVCLYRLNGSLVPWGWSNYLVGAAAPDLTLARYCATTAVSCIPYNLMLITAGAGLGDIALMEVADFTPAALGVAFWVMAGIGASIGLVAAICGAVQLHRLLREEAEAERLEQELEGEQPPKPKPKPQLQPQPQSPHEKDRQKESRSSSSSFTLPHDQLTQKLGAASAAAVDAHASVSPSNDAENPVGQRDSGLGVCVPDGSQPPEP
jgi:hypothetical protein